MNPNFFERECKDTLIIRGFPNFLAKKCKKSAFCNVEMAELVKGSYLGGASNDRQSRAWLRGGRVQEFKRFKG